MIEPCISCASKACCTALSADISTGEALGLARVTGLPIGKFATDRAAATLRRLGLSGGAVSAATRRHLDTFNASHTLIQGPTGGVFLSAGVCTVYQHRPRVCREYTVDRCVDIREGRANE